MFSSVYQNVVVYIRELHHSLKSLKEQYPNVKFITYPDTSKCDEFLHFQEAYNLDYSYVQFFDCRSRIAHEFLCESIIQSSPSTVYIHKGDMLPTIWGCYPNQMDLKDKFLFFQKNVLAEPNRFVEWFVHNSDSCVMRYEDRFIVTPDYFKYLKKFYVINPDKYVNRLNRLKESFKKSTILSNMEMIRIRGCTKEEEPIPYWFRQGHTDNQHYWLVNQDHRRILKEALCNEDDLCLVFEDDTILRDNFDNRLIDFLDRCDQNGIDWCALMLGGSDWHTQLGNFDYLPNDIKRVRGVYGQHAVLYNYTGLHGLYGHSYYHITENIDVAFAGFQKQDGRVYTDKTWLVDAVGNQNGTDN